MSTSKTLTVKCQMGKKVVYKKLFSDVWVLSSINVYSIYIYIVKSNSMTSDNSLLHHIFKLSIVYLIYIYIYII